MKRELSFKNLYIHEGNEVAYLATQKLCDSPGELFNPFYVFSDTGMGKTHLLRAIHFGLSQKVTTLFFTAKEFEKYLDEGKKINTPVIIDDLHNISKKYHEMISEIIDVSLANNRQICFSGNLAPRDLEELDQKLLSRLESGLVCDIQPPNEDVLADMMKKKAEESEIILPDDVVSELAHICNGSIRTVEGMINRLKAHSSLGDLSIDINNIRSILKEFYPKGAYTPVSSLVQEFKKDAADVLKQVSKKLNIRDEYKEKIDLWEMKGFDTSSLKILLDDDITTLKRGYDDFIKKVRRLTELQKEFGLLDTSNFSDEAMKIESMLFSPKHVDEIERLVARINEGAEGEKPAEIKKTPVEEKPPEIKEPIEKGPVETFGTFIIGDNNRNAYTIYQKQILQNLGKKLNPFIIRGKSGTGKTHFLKAINSGLKSKNISINFFDLSKKREIRKACKAKNVDVLILDNFHHIFSASKDQRKRIFKIILSYIKEDRAVFLGSEVFPSDVSVSEEEKIIFEVGIEVEFTAPDSDIAGQYIQSKLAPDKAAKIIERGLPKFESFYEIDDFLSSFEIKAAPEVVSLGFPGEESKEHLPEIETEEVVARVATIEDKNAQEEKLISIQHRRLRMSRDEMYIFPEVLDELVEESY